MHKILLIYTYTYNDNNNNNNENKENNNAHPVKLNYPLHSFHLHLHLPWHAWHFICLASSTRFPFIFRKQTSTENFAFLFRICLSCLFAPHSPLPPSHPRPLLLGPVWCHLLRVLILLCSRCWRLTHNFLCLFGLRIVFPPYPVNYDLPRYGRYADRMMMDDY